MLSLSSSKFMCFETLTTNVTIFGERVSEEIINNEVIRMKL